MRVCGLSEWRGRSSRLAARGCGAGARMGETRAQAVDVRARGEPSVAACRGRKSDSATGLNRGHHARASQVLAAPHRGVEARPRGSAQRPLCTRCRFDKHTTFVGADAGVINLHTQRHAKPNIVRRLLALPLPAAAARSCAVLQIIFLMISRAVLPGVCILHAITLLNHVSLRSLAFSPTKPWSNGEHTV